MSQVQRVASWRGKDSPPRVVAVVNPHSGKGAGRTVFSQQVRTAFHTVLLVLCCLCCTA